MEENLKVDKKFKEAFNLGYEAAQNCKRYLNITKVQNCCPWSKNAWKNK
jgi:hypothetical protein